MAENKENENAENGEKMISQSDVENIVKARLKNHLEREAHLNTKLEQLQMAQNQAPEAPMPQPQPQAPEAQAPEASSQSAPLGASAPLTQADLQNVMAQNQAQQQVQQANNYHQNAIAQMSQDDPEFKTLVEKNDGLKVPQEVAMHLTNSLGKNAAHKVLKKLLTSQMDNANMQANAYKGLATGNWDDYQNWLQGLLAQNKAPNVHDSTPDLSSVDKAPSDEGQAGVQDAMDDFIKGN